MPTFRRQIEAGGPVTVTQPEMTRYFMIVPGAVSLILQAGAMAEAYGTYVLEMGRPVKIVDLAQMIEVMGARGVKMFTGFKARRKAARDALREVRTARRDRPPDSLPSRPQEPALLRPAGSRRGDDLLRPPRRRREGPQAPPARRAELLGHRERRHARGALSRRSSRPLALLPGGSAAFHAEVEEVAADAQRDRDDGQMYEGQVR